MQYALSTLIYTNQEAAIKNYGDKIWEELCDVFTEAFTLEEAAGKLDCIKHLAPTTRKQYIKCVLFNVLADANKRPDVYEGGSPVRRHGRRKWDVIG